uniref:Group-specific protein n=1 Tax=Globodera pallida TaxID=36090 RepID=A0A183CBL2_GLOPA
MNFKSVVVILLAIVLVFDVIAAIRKYCEQLQKKDAQQRAAHDKQHQHQNFGIAVGSPGQFVLSMIAVAPMLLLHHFQ